MTLIKYYFEHIKDGQISEGYTAINIVNYEAEIANDDPDAVLVARKNDGVPKEMLKWEERFRLPSQPPCGFFWLTDSADLKSLSESDIGEHYFEIGIPLELSTLADVVYDHLPHTPRGYLSVERVDRLGPFRLSCQRWGRLGELQLSKRGDDTILRLDYVPSPTPNELSPVKMLGESNLFWYGKRKHRGEVIRRLFKSLRQDPIWQSKPFTEAATSRLAEGVVRLNIGINTVVVRELLIAAFDDTDLMTLCFECFYPVYNEKFGAGMSKGEKVQSLLDYCVHHGQLEALLKQVEERNPYQYKIYADRIFTT